MSTETHVYSRTSALKSFFVRTTIATRARYRDMRIAPMPDIYSTQIVMQYKRVMGRGTKYRGRSKTRKFDVIIFARCNYIFIYI